MVHTKPPLRALIVYGSRYGHTHKVAERIDSMLHIAGADVTLLPVDAVTEPFDLSPYGLIVIAGSVYFGKHQKALARFVRAHLRTIAAARSVFVSVSGAARSAEGLPVAEENVRAFLSVTGWTPDKVELVGGGEPYASKYGFFMKRFMRRLSKKMGRSVDITRDYDFTDWDAVDQFARDLASDRATVRRAG